MNSPFSHFLRWGRSSAATALLARNRAPRASSIALAGPQSRHSRTSPLASAEPSPSSAPAGPQSSRSQSARLLRFLIPLLLALLLACATTPTPTPAPTSTPVPPQAALRTADAFLAAWQQQNYPAMYALLSTAAQAETDATTFTRWHTDFAEAATLQRSTITRYTARADGERIDVGYRAELTTALFKTLVLENHLRLVEESGRWRVAWTPGTLVVGLTHGGAITRTTEPAPRGRILDSQGRVLAESEVCLIVGAVPGEIDDRDAFAFQLSALTEVPTTTLLAALNDAQPNWFVPLTELPAAEGERLKAQLAGLSGVRFRTGERRRYPQGRSLAHTVGYVGEITAEQLAQPAYTGYDPGALVGQTGVEAWAEPYLAGDAAARLVALAPDGSLSRVLAEAELAGSQDVMLTLDLAFQQTVEAILGERKGAIVALDPEAGVIHALATYPAFDPGRLLADDAYRAALFEDLAAPLLNRATQAALPPGSVFKIVTMAAGLESGLYTIDTTYTCTGSWTGLGPEIVMYDWFRSGHGTLTLHEALVHSCNPYFWQLGLTLDAHDPAYLPTVARQFGLGQQAGLVGGEDAAGQIPDPAWKAAQGEAWWAGDAVNMATGQGELLATPLQMANVLASVANRGVIYQPRLVAQISGGEDAAPVASEVRLETGIAPATLDAVHAALVDVTGSEVGTAHTAFAGFPLAVAGKTGTAENPGGAPHAWFAGYAPVEDPQLVVAVMLENGGEGSRDAAPLARQVLAAYLGSGP